MIINCDHWQIPLIFLIEQTRQRQNLTFKMNQDRYTRVKEMILFKKDTIVFV